MIIHNLTDVRRPGYRGARKSISVWPHKVVRPGRSVKVPAAAKRDPRLIRFAEEGAISFDFLPDDYQIAKGLKEAEPAEKPEAPSKPVDEPEKLSVNQIMSWKKAEIVQALKDADVDHDARKKKLVLAEILYEAQ